MLQTYRDKVQITLKEKKSRWFKKFEKGYKKKPWIDYNTVINFKAIKRWSLCIFLLIFFTVSCYSFIETVIKYNKVFSKIQCV